MGCSDLGGQEVSDSFVSCRDWNEIQQDILGTTQSVASLPGMMKRSEDAIQEGPGAGMLIWDFPPFQESSFTPLGAVLGAPESSLRKSPDKVPEPLILNPIVSTCVQSSVCP